MWAREVLARAAHLRIYKNHNLTKKDRRELSRRFEEYLTKMTSDPDRPELQPERFSSSEANDTIRSGVPDCLDAKRVYSRRDHMGGETCQGASILDAVIPADPERPGVWEREQEYSIPTPDTVDRYAGVCGAYVPLMVNINSDNRTLTKSFSRWLKEIRRLGGSKKHRPFNGSDFSNWHRYRILPAFDLLHWRALTASLYTDAMIATVLWPGGSDSADGVDLSERFRRVTKPLVEQIFSMPRGHSTV